ncbi:MAG: hypothetical protein F2534_17845 [Actinobacteria bacterium]|uniref:Unannotated protein n=1 Tax=freshwater metagenome TaxID=449393 RepID=A0A6J6FCR5_9ZZZZ|nr:hypothetical protein [Actinomycetota bacterium]
MTHPVWPLFDLRVTTPRLELRYVDDDLALELAELATRGVHDPEYMPFVVEWTDIELHGVEACLDLFGAR